MRAFGQTCARAIRTHFPSREDVYARRWENAKGESGYSPAVTRNWTAIKRSPPEERKKADQQTRIPSPPPSVLAKMRPPNKIRKRPALHLTVSSSRTFGQPPHNSGRITRHSEIDPGNRRPGRRNSVRSSVSGMSLLRAGRVRRSDRIAYRYGDLTLRC